MIESWNPLHVNLISMLIWNRYRYFLLFQVFCSAVPLHVRKHVLCGSYVVYRKLGAASMDFEREYYRKDDGVKDHLEWNASVEMCLEREIRESIRIHLHG